MDEKPEPPAEPDSPGQRAPPAPAQAVAYADILDPNSLLTKNQRQQLTALTQRCMAMLTQDQITGELRIEIVNDQRMTHMHETHKGISGTTDVLTFDLAPGNATLLDVDVLVCADEATRQAKSRGHDTINELMLYIVHAALHCTGYDDTHDGELGSAAMHAREDEILKALGLGAVFYSAGTEGRS